jgi:hypothetical protein
MGVSHDPHPRSGLRLHLHVTSLTSMNLITERADMPCIVACMFQSLILGWSSAIYTKSQILLLTATQKQPPVMRSVNIHGPSLKDGGTQKEGHKLTRRKANWCRRWHASCITYSYSTVRHHRFTATMMFSYHEQPLVQCIPAMRLLLLI